MVYSGDWTDTIHAVAVLDAATGDSLRTFAHPVSAPAQTVVFSEGKPCEAYLILLSGVLKVCKVTKNGREIVLYRVEAGATCIVTTACVLAGLPYDAEGIAETDIQAQALPIGRFFQLLGQSATFREFVFRAFGTRIADLLMLIEEVAFGRIDQRLASHLLERSRGRGTLRVTHHDLAVDLGTAREVVSRQLKEFERKGWVILARGQIELAEVAALQALVTNT